MAESDADLRRLLDLFRKGGISEDMLVEKAGSAAKPPAENGAHADTTSDTRRRILEELDHCRAAEASGATTLEAWADIAKDPALAGGLRTAAAREATHAILLERRVRELGGEPAAELPDWLVRFNAAILDADAEDVDRLGAIVAQFPDPELAVEQLQALADAAGDDELTREMLLTIREDELTTLRWMHASYARLKARR